MNATENEYVKSIGDGLWRIGSSRVSLDSIVHAYWNGRMPEAIVADFPSLSLEQFHGAIAWYLQNRNEVDRSMQARDVEWENFRIQSEKKHGPMIRMMRQRALAATGIES